MEKLVNDYMKEKFEIAKLLDKCRWNESNEQLDINWHEDINKTDDLVLLTHIICYVSDRQMIFEKVWNIGGYVYSSIIDKYLNRNQNTYEMFNIGTKQTVIKSLKGKNKKDNASKEKYLFYATTDGKNKYNNEFKEIRENFQNSKINDVLFISRFYPSDYMSIVGTLKILEDSYNKKISQYIDAIIPKEENNPTNIVLYIFYGLYLLIYNYNNQLKMKEIMENNYEKLKNNVKEREDIIEKYIEYINNLKTNDDAYDNIENFINLKSNNKLKSFKKDVRYNSKRLWCTLRDFLKNERFNYNFYNILNKTAKDKLFVKNKYGKIFPKQEAELSLELPGDVWNNNIKFKECMQFNGNKKMPEIVRKQCDELNKKENTNYYPEQFDITFDLVSRMCENYNKCSLCPFGKYKVSDFSKFKKDEFFKLCINDKSKYCPVIANACGYTAICEGKDKCTLINLILKE